MADVVYTANTKDCVDGSRVGERNALEVLSHVYFYQVGTDAAEASSTTRLIVATSHAAVAGDMIRFTSGNLDGKSYSVESIPDANSIKTADVMSEAPGVGDTFVILSPREGQVDSSGRLLVDATVSEVATAADGAALPAQVKVIGGFDGAVVQAIATDASGNLQVDVIDLLKAEDAAHVSGDSGVMLLGVRNDADAALTGTDGDYTPLSVDSTGRLKVDAALTEAATAADGAAAPALGKVVMGVDGVGNSQFISTDTNGRANVNVVDPLPAGTNNIGDIDVLSEPATSADAAAGLPAVSKVIAGYDGTNVRTVHVDAAGDVQVDLASALPAGTNNIGDVDVLTEPATSADAAAGLPAVSKVMAGYDGANVRTLKTDAAGELQVDLASSIPAGTNNIGDVDIASALPAGTNTIGSVNTNTLDVVDLLDSNVIDATTINGSAGAFVEVVASTAAAVKKIQVMDTSGAFIGVYTGAAASEALKFIFGPGSDQTVEVSITAGTRISLRSMESAAPTTGSIALNLLG